MYLPNRSVRGGGHHGTPRCVVGERRVQAWGWSGLALHGREEAAGRAGRTGVAGRSAENSLGHVESCEFTGTQTTWRRREGCSAGWVAWWPQADGAWLPVHLLVGFPC